MFAFQSLQVVPNLPVGMHPRVPLLHGDGILEVRVMNVFGNSGETEREVLVSNRRSVRVVRAGVFDRLGKLMHVRLAKAVQISRDPCSNGQECVLWLLLNHAEEPERREDPHGEFLVSPYSTAANESKDRSRDSR